MRSDSLAIPCKDQSASNTELLTAIHHRPPIRAYSKHVEEEIVGRGCFSLKDNTHFLLSRTPPLIGDFRLKRKFIPLAFGVALCSAWGVRPASAQVLNLDTNTTWDTPGTAWTGQWLHVGTTNTTTLNVLNGAEVYARTGTGPNIQLGNGPGTQGTMNITGPGTLVSTGRFGVGSLNDARGILTVEENARLVADSFNVAASPTNLGSVTIRTGGRIESSTAAVIGVNGTGTATVDGVGSALDVNGNLFVGRNATGNGTLNIINGGTVSAGVAAIGLTGVGQVTVQGAGSNLTVGEELRLGQLINAGSTSTLTISDHGVVTSDYVTFGTGTGTINLNTDGVLATGHIQGSGGTNGIAFDGGTLRLTQDQSALFTGLSAGSMTLGAGGGIFDTQRYDVSAVSDISGTGALTKTGTGTLRFMVPASYTGNTLVEQGTLAAGGNDTFAPLSHHVVRSNGTLFAGDFDQTLSSLQNEGVVSLAGGIAGNVFTVANNYVGAGGTIILDTVLGNDASPTDLLRIQGDSLGAGTLRIQNAGGRGAQTDNGIKVIDVTGASTGSFTLLGDYVHQGEQSVVGGAYAYKLYQDGKSTPGDGDWYLRSELTTAGPKLEPLYQAGAPVYETYPQFLLGLNGLPTLRQRVGNRIWANGGADYAGDPEAGSGVHAQHNGVWGRIEGVHNALKPGSSTTGAEYDYNTFRLQAGVDGLLKENKDGALISGLAVHYTHGSAHTRSIYDADMGGGRIGTDGYGLTGTLTWYGEGGSYLDGQGQVSRYDSNLSINGGNQSLVRDSDGFGYALSIEAGQRVALDSAWSLTPQAQLVYSSVDFDDFTDTFGAPISLDHGDSLQGRLGIAIDYGNSWQNAKGIQDRAHVYGIANLYHEFLDGTRVDVAGTRFSSKNDRWWGGVGIGGSYDWGGDKYSIYGEGLVKTSLNNFGDSYAITGTIGLRVRW